MFKGSREEREIRFSIPSPHSASDDTLLHSDKIFLCALYLNIRANTFEYILFFCVSKGLAGSFEVLKGSREEREIRFSIPSPHSASGDTLLHSNKIFRRIFYLRVQDVHTFSAKLTRFQNGLDNMKNWSNFLKKLLRFISFRKVSLQLAYKPQQTVPTQTDKSPHMPMLRRPYLPY